MSIVEKLRLLFKLQSAEKQVEAISKEKAPMKVKVPQLVTLFASLAATLGLPTLLANFVHAHPGLYLGIVAAAVVLHAVLPSVFGAPSDDDKNAVGLKSIALFAILVLFATGLHAQTAAPAPGVASNFYAGGISYNGSGTPQIAGNAVYGHDVSTDTIPGLYAVSIIDILPTGTKPFTATTNIGAGVAQRVMAVAGYPVFVLTTTGPTVNGPNTGWNYTGGAATVIRPFKNKSYFLMPHARFLKSSVSNNSGYQPIVGVDIGFGK